MLLLDPLHGKIRVSDSFRETIESPPLARLRNVRQLGFTLASYPGAVHTRFEHTIGTVGVLTSLMASLDVPNAERDIFMAAALFSEIGIFPLSYSTRLIFANHGLSKAEYARGIYKRYLQQTFPLSEGDATAIFGGALRPSWFAPVMQYSEFEYLHPVDLASTIDYVLRDSYYTGRYVGGFDYRHFMALLRPGSDSSGALREGLRALHRAVHSLNATYGDPLRRILTQVLKELVETLVTGGYLDPGPWKEIERYVELDDDEFLSQVQEAARRAELTGDDRPVRMISAVTQRVAPDLKTIKRSDLNDGSGSLRERAAFHFKRSIENVFAAAVDGDDGIGFRMFGTDFPSLRDAMRSESFGQCTGLRFDNADLSDDVWVAFI
jgi:HD superfamily phosphohydrolase